MGAKIVKMLNINQISNKYFLSKKCFVKIVEQKGD